MNQEALSRAVLDVLAERNRQTGQEGWTTERDDRFKRGEIAIAAALYLLMQTEATVNEPFGVRNQVKTMGRRDNLVRGIALGLAELERFDRTLGALEPGPEALAGRDRQAGATGCADRCAAVVCFECHDR